MNALLLASVPVLQGLVGKLVKSHPNIDNKFIPLFTFLAAVLGFSATPIVQNAGSAGAAAAQVGLASAISTVAVTGLHSIFKNSLGKLLSPLFGFLGGSKSTTSTTVGNAADPIVPPRTM